MKKLTIIFIVVFVIFSVLVVINLMYKPHKDIATSKADFNLNSKELYEKFSQNETEALKMYSNKVILSSGKITEIDSNNKTIIVDSILFFQFDEFDKNQFQVNQNISIKARLVGFDELMNEIKLDQSTINQ